MVLIQCLTAVLLLLLDLCAGQRMVSIQKGRLYRARSYHITIWCNVSGYQGPSEQNFQWSIYLPSAPEKEIQIISTNDNSFSFIRYTQPVKSGRIYIERIQGDSVLLHIKELQDQDAGEYECSTPSTDSQYLGTYSAKMDLSVIPDMLSAAMKPQVLTRVQGDSLELICEVSTATAQHTHLSVAWYLLKEDHNGQAQKIISLSRDFVLIPGSLYTERLSLGDIRVDKIGDKIYKLSIVNIQPLDQGEMYCEAVEWIQDPDETWKDIARKQTERTSLTVRSLDKNIYVKISAAETSLVEGNVLQLSCTVESQNTQYRWFQLAWLHRGMVVASIDQYGALTLQNNNQDRYSMGKLQVMKPTNDKYILRINEVELSDKGPYSCEVSEIEKAPTGTFTRTQQSSSPGIDIHVKLRESHLKLFLWVNEEHIIEGEALIFHCNVSITDNSLSVNWWHIQKARDLTELIVSMDQGGRLKIGTSYLERGAHGDLRVEKVDASTFILAIYNTSASSDTGLYRCEVSEWAKGRSWKHTQEISTTVEPLGLNLKAVTISRVANVKLQEDFELFCKVSPDHITNKAPLSITWQFRPSSDLVGSYQQVVRITAEGTIEWGQAHLHLQKKIKISKSSSLSRLLIHSASWQDAGMYRCEVEAWRNSQQVRDSALPDVAAVASNSVEIKVTKPESKLRVNMDAKSLEISGNEDIEIECKIISLTKENSQLGVMWYFVPLSVVPAAPQLIIRSNYSNILEYGEAFDSLQQKSRFHSEKVSSHLYQLRILSVNEDISGGYYCIVQEWIWSLDSGWYELGKMESGRTMVHFKRSDYKPQIEKANHSITATENEDVTLKCILQSPMQHTSRFSISWFRVSLRNNTEPLVKMKHNGVIEYSTGKLARRLHLHCPSVGDFRLTLQNVELVDAGMFYCQVEEWHAINCSTQVHYAAEPSGYSQLVVLPLAGLTNSTEICTPSSLFHFILLYPLVLLLILVAVFLFLRFKNKKKQKLKLEKKQYIGEGIRMTPVQLKASDENSDCFQ
ncbi:immunoglobulin superfamily member 2 [Hemicordylus capensis]|uniref:immunoglobulin superfamily member 2 n=1 Tax=Hemicordylus capensis TaxID=884348 RepID=UPI002303BE1F|nr:immunoglobulin superfamily member 2 [Hemicordylus capensis]